MEPDDENLTGAPIRLPSIWKIIDQFDLNSVENNEEVTLQAFFVLIYQMVKEHNMDRSNTSLFFSLYFGKWEEDPSFLQCLSSDDYMFFENPNKELLIIPVLKNNHYFVIFVDYRRRKIIVCDSYYKTLLEEKTIRSFLNDIKEPCGGFRFVYPRKHIDIFEQTDGFNCGILALFNIEKYLETGGFSKNCRTDKLRQQYFKNLECFKKEVESNGNKTTSNNKSKMRLLLGGCIRNTRSVETSEEDLKNPENGQENQSEETNSESASPTNRDGLKRRLMNLVTMIKNVILVLAIFHVLGLISHQ